MARRPRINHGSAFKAKVAIAALKEQQTLVRPKIDTIDRYVCTI